MQQDGQQSVSPASVGSGQKDSKSLSNRGKRVPLVGKRVAAPNSPIANPNCSQPFGGTMVSEHHNGSRSPRCDFSRRKEAARRSLMGSIYTKHSNVRRSFSFVAGERPQVEVRFPRVFYKEKQDKSRESPHEESRNAPISQANNPRRERKRSDHSAHSQSLTVDTNPIKDLTTNSKVSRTGSQKLSLPGIIMDFNLSANMAALGRGHERMPSDTISDDDDERMFGVPYEGYLKKTHSAHTNNPIRGKYRPLTPGLLENLNKLKVPSKVKTEQWVKANQMSKKSYYVDTYRIGSIDSSNKMAYPNWIYTDP